MGLTAISFGIACAVVLVTTAFCRSRDGVIAALVLCAMWCLTKLFPMPYASAGGIMLDAFCALLGSLAGLYLVARRPTGLTPWLFLSSMMFTGLLVALWALLRNLGFGAPSYPYALASNLLYLIAMLCVLSLGLHDGAVHIRRWLCDNPHDRPWSRPGAKWGREIPRRPR